MTIETVLVSGEIYNPDGSFAVDTPVRFTLSGLGVVGLSLVVPRFADTITDAMGKFALQVVPSPPGTHYSVRASRNGSLLFAAQAVVPDNACQLTQILQALPMPSIPAAQQALIDLQAAQAEIEADRQSAAASAVSAAQNAIQVSEDVIQTGDDRVATGQDRIATGLDLVQTALDRLATGQDRTATADDRRQTGEDRSATTLSAGTASTHAQTAIDKALEAGQYASTASTASGEAVDAAALASSKAGEASGSAAAALASKNAAGDKAAQVEAALLASPSAAALAVNLAASSGASLVGHIAPGTGAVARTVAQKLVGLSISPEDFGAVAYSTRAAAEVGADSTAAIKLALAQWYIAGGTLFLSGWYRVTEAFLLNNSNTPTTFGVQPPLRITGIGGHGSGRGIKANSGAGIVWTAETGTAVAKIDTRGNGLLVLDNCTLASSAASGNVKPFVRTTYTVIKTGIGFALDGGTYGNNAAEDGFVLGGETSHEQTPGFDLTSSDAGFQGYGTVIDSVQCNGLRRLAVLQRYANAVRVTNNSIWNTCGNNSATGGAIEVNGAPSGVQGYAVGAYIHGNLIELTRYKYGIHLKNATHADIAGNDGYDATALTLATVFVDVATCQNIRIRPSLAPAAKPYVLPDPKTVTGIFVSAAESSFYDVTLSLKAGIAGTPNLFGPTTFENPQNTVFQNPGASGSQILLHLKRGLTDATDPGVSVFTVDGIGGVALGSLSSSGNVANSLPTGASKWNNGRSWGFNGLAGSNMAQNSGTGGSTYTAQNFSFIYKDHTGATVGRIGKHHGGSGLEGVSFGVAYDVEMYRHSSTVLRSNVKLTALLGIGVGNSVAATTPGSVVKKMEVFDAAGVSLGFVAIYSSIA